MKFYMGRSVSTLIRAAVYAAMENLPALAQASQDVSVHIRCPPATVRKLPLRTNCMSKFIKMLLPRLV
eukprot:3316195-Pyramimonas_sp.AAC.1